MDDDTFDAEPGTSSSALLAATVPLRARHDGWTPEKQHRFIQALAESGCVAEACAAVGMSAASAYKLRTRPDANIFRQAWDIALDQAIRRLSDAAYSRALHGVATPVFYKGEQIGERRRYDERLTMFLLRYRDPTRYGAWLDRYEARRHPDGPGITLAYALNRLMDEAYGAVDPADEDRPLAEGPPMDGFHEDQELARQEAVMANWSEDARENGRAIYRHLRELREKPPEDPTVQDMRDPLTVHRPLSRSRCGRDVP
jgi:hypothetical protein